MPRDLTDEFMAQTVSQVVREVWFCQLTMLDGSILNLWNGFDYKVWNSITWTPLGYMGEVSDIPESAEFQAESINLMLTGVPAYLIGEAIGNLRQGQPATLFYGFLDSAENVVADPCEGFAGLVDTVSTEEHAETCAINIAIENPMIRLQKPQNYTYTDADQQYFFPGDRGFEFVPQLQTSPLSWGGSSNVPQLQPVSAPRPGNAP